MNERQGEDLTETREAGQSPEDRPWRPSPFLFGSVLLHALALPALFANPHRWRAIGSLVLLDHLLLSTVGMLPRSRALGPNLTRLPAAVHGGRSLYLTFDDGPDPTVTPRVLDLLDEHDAKASFFCIGERAEQHASLTREIVDRGHQLENHTYHHPLGFAFKGPRGLEREIVDAQRALTRLGNREPGYFRAPAGIRNPLLDPILHRLGLRLAAWTRRGFDTVESDPRRVARRLLRGMRAGDILLLHDGSAARDHHGQAVILEVLPLLLDQMQRHDLTSRPLP